MTTTWHDYYHAFEQHGHSVSGTIKVAHDIYSPQLNNRRHLLVYLPPSYAQSSSRRYPVLYMQDGQNLFDNTTSFAGEWGVDEAMEELAHKKGLEAIIVGIPNAGSMRLAEYSPFPDSQMGGGLGDNYVAFVVHTIKPIIDRDFRTLPDRSNCGIMGSSMGRPYQLIRIFPLPPSFWFRRSNESITLVWARPYSHLCARC